MTDNVDLIPCPVCDGEDNDCATCDGAGVVDNSVIDSPSGWSYRASQENGDQVDCYECGNPLNDDLPIVNDADGYAYHDGCSRHDPELLKLADHVEMEHERELAPGTTLAQVREQHKKMHEQGDDDNQYGHTMADHRKGKV